MSDWIADKAATKGRTLFRWLGVRWTVDADSWQFIISRLTVSFIVALLFSPATNFGLRVVHGVAYAALLMLAQFLHVTGHTLGGKAVGAPMDENRI